MLLYLISNIYTITNIVEKRKNIIIIFSYNSHIMWCVSI